MELLPTFTDRKLLERDLRQVCESHNPGWTRSVMCTECFYINPMLPTPLCFQHLYAHNSTCVQVSHDNSRLASIIDELRKERLRIAASADGEGQSTAATDNDSSAST